MPTFHPAYLLAQSRRQARGVGRSASRAASALAAAHPRADDRAERSVTSAPPSRLPCVRAWCSVAVALLPFLAALARAHGVPGRFRDRTSAGCAGSAFQCERDPRAHAAFGLALPVSRALPRALLRARARGARRSRGHALGALAARRRWVALAGRVHAARRAQRGARRCVRPGAPLRVADRPRPGLSGGGAGRRYRRSEPGFQAPEYDAARATRLRSRK